MSELRTALRIDLVGNLPGQANRYAASVQQFVERSRGHLSRMQSSFSAMAAGLDRFGNRWTALASGATVAAMARQVATLEHRYTMLGIQAQLGADGVAKLKDEIFDVARQPDIRVQPDSILSGVESIVEKTGDLQFAQDQIRNIGLLVRATGAEGRAAGELLGEFQKMGIAGSDAVMAAIDTLNQQGKAGAFTLQNLAALGPRVVTAYTAAGRGGQDAIREMGAALQVIRQGTGSAEMAATAWEALIRTLTNAKKLEGTNKTPGITAPIAEGGLGIQVWDVEGLKQGKEILRSVPELMKEIIKASEGKRSVLGQWFDEEAIRAFNAPSAEYQRTGRFDSLDKFMSVAGTGEGTQEDAARAARDAASALDLLTATIQRNVDALGDKPLRVAADAVGSVSTPAMDTAAQAGMLGIGLGAGAIGLKTLGLTAGSMGAAGLAGLAGGYAVGTVAYDRGIAGTGVGDAIGEGIARGLALLGSDEAKQAVAASQPAGKTLDDYLRAYDAAEAARTESAAAKADAAASSAESVSASQAAQVAATAAVAESVSASQAAQAAATAAVAEAKAAAATVAKGIHGTIRVVVEGPAKVAGVTGSGPVDIEASAPYTGKTMGGF